MSKADSLTSKQINRVLRTCQLMPNSQSKRCVLVLSHAAVRVSEVAQIQVKTILYPSGKIKDEIYLPSAICKNLKSRSAWLTNPKSKQIIQEWIDYRLSKKWGVMPGSTEFQGLNPNSKLIFSNRGCSYSLQNKKRIMQDGTIKIYRACDSLEQQLRSIYKQCGLSSASSHSGRKSLVTNAIIAGVELEQMARILGHASTETTISYVVVDQKRIKEMYKLDWI
ncbi:MAG: site-specific integrase [Saccharospirillaceae bacterium]|nr:site-specific integrase [Saccharospirillaceae bacterium]